MSLLKVNNITDLAGNSLLLPLSSNSTKGATLKSDGANAFWNIPTDDSQYYKGTVTRGYTLGGYYNSVAYKLVSKTTHSSDVTTSLGAILTYFDAYTAGASSGGYAYTFCSVNNTADSNYASPGTAINRFNMLTDSNSPLGTVMPLSNQNTVIMRYQFKQCYIFGGTSNPQKFVYSNETPSTTPAWFNSIGATSCCYGSLRGRFDSGGASTSILDFVTESWSSLGTFSSAAFTKAISTFTGYSYIGTAPTTIVKTQDYAFSTVYLTITRPSHQEEIFHTGETRGYSIGGYTTATWSSDSYVLNYASDTYVLGPGSLFSPVVISSAAGVEYGRFAI
jgi:hypothetical protein